MIRRTAATLAGALAVTLMTGPPAQAVAAPCDDIRFTIERILDQAGDPIDQLDLIWDMSDGTTYAKRQDTTPEWGCAY